MCSKPLRSEGRERRRSPAAGLRPALGSEAGLRASWVAARVGGAGQGHIVAVHAGGGKLSRLAFGPVPRGTRRVWQQPGWGVGEDDDQFGQLPHRALVGVCLRVRPGRPVSPSDRAGTAVCEGVWGRPCRGRRLGRRTVRGRWPCSRPTLAQAAGRKHGHDDHASHPPQVGGAHHARVQRTVILHDQGSTIGGDGRFPRPGFPWPCRR
jgi:hypothetical protein